MVRASLLAILTCLTALLQLAEPAEFYVDPVHGDMNNDGSVQKPWRSLQAVFDKGFVASRQWDKLPFKVGAGAGADAGRPLGRATRSICDLEITAS